VNYEEILDKVNHLISRADRFTDAFIRLNFSIGSLVNALMEDARYGDSVILRLSEDLTKLRGYTVYPQRLWECARVYKSFEGNISKIWALEKSMQIKLTWSFLVRNCTKAPAPGSSVEYTNYWQSKLSYWENTLQEISTVSVEKDTIITQSPEPLKQELKGFFEAVKPLTECSAVEEFNTLMTRINILLDKVIAQSVFLSPSTRAVLEEIHQKIGRILEHVSSLQHKGKGYY